MSFREMEWAIQTTVPSTGCKVILMLMAHRGRDNDEGCWPSIGRLAQEAEMTERGVRKCVDQLVQANLLQKQFRHHESGRATSNSYRLMIPADWNPELSSSSPPSNPELSSSSPPSNPELSSGGRMNSVHPLNHKKESKKESKKEPPSVDAERVPASGRDGSIEASQRAVAPISDGAAADPAVQHNGRPPTLPLGPVVMKLQPLSARDAVWSEGLPILQILIGKSQSQCRSVLGKLISAAKDDCAKVLSALKEAEDLRPIDPSAWLFKAVKTTPRRNPYFKIAEDIENGLDIGNMETGLEFLERAS